MLEMEACWPSGVGPAGVGVKPPCAALAEDRRGERQGNGAALIASGGDQEGVPEALGRGCPGRACAVEASKVRDGIEIGGPAPSLEMSLAGARVPGQAVPGVEAA